MNKIKVNIFSPGRFHVCDLARELDKNGYDVKFYSYVPTKRAEKFGLPHRCNYSLLIPMAPFLVLTRVVLKQSRWAKHLSSIFQDWISSIVMRKCDVCIAMTGNYIDFGTPSNVNEEKFDELVENAKNIKLDETAYRNLKNDLYHAKKLVVLTDNCGEIVFDKIMIKILKTFYPSLEITAIVRGLPALNDATMDDARQIGLTDLINVIGNGTDIAGTVFDQISKEAQTALKEADVVISKGLGNFETLNGCNLNVYYLFMCKCKMFAEKFQKNLFEGILINDRSIV